MTSSSDALAAALADALLAGPWEVDAAARRAARVVGRRPALLASLAREIVQAHPRAPYDAPRALAAEVARSPELALLLRRRSRRPLRVTAHLVQPVRPLGLRWGLPALDDVGALAAWLAVPLPDLLWLADPQGRLAREERPLLHTHRRTWVPTRSGGVRLLEAPLPRLAGLQRRLLDEVLGHVPVHAAAHGFVPGRSVLTHAAAHSGRSLVVSLDLEGFFAAVTAARVYGVLRVGGYAEPVAHLLTGLLTTRTPLVVRRLVPRPADPSPAALDRRRRLLADLARPHLAQGAPSSPYVANLVAHALDRRLTGLARRWGATYTRYADDLTFSADRRVPVGVLLAAVEAVVRSERFRVHEGKTRVTGAGSRQVVTGLVVNAAPAVARPDYDRLKARVHLVALGREVLDAEGLQRLRGQVSWVAQTSPARGARLLGELLPVLG